MSSTLSTTQMVAKLQRKFPLGLGTNDCMEFLNEAFRKIDQMSKGGFIWQLKVALVILPAGAQTQVFLPTDFDPGKSAWLQGDPNPAHSPTVTGIPYKTMTDFVNQQNFQVTGPGNFACWTFVPNFTLTSPTNYKYLFGFAPLTAFPLSAQTTFTFFYHALNFQPFAVDAATYFPTPDQFDSLIVDLAEAELARVYKVSGYEIIAAQAMNAVAQMIDTYRTDRYDLAGISDIVAQTQEKAAERSR